MFTASGKVQGISRGPAGADPLFNKVSVLFNWEGTAGASIPTTELSSRHLAVSASGTAMTQNGDNTITFNGTNQALAVAANAALAMTGACCVEVWLTPTYQAGDQAFLSSGSFSTVDDWKFETTGSSVALLPDGSQPSTFYKPSANPSAGRHHFCWTRDTSNIVRMYIDGVIPGGIVSSTFTGTKGSASKPLNIGTLLSSGLFYKGIMGPVRITVGDARYATGGFTPPNFGAFPTF